MIPKQIPLFQFRLLKARTSTSGDGWLLPYNVNEPLISRDVNGKNYKFDGVSETGGLELRVITVMMTALRGLTCNLATLNEVVLTSPMPVHVKHG